MSAEILSFPRQRTTHEAEALVLGALLALPDKLELLDAMGLQQDDLVDGRVWQTMRIIRLLAERRDDASATAVWSRGSRAGLLPAETLEWLVELEARNTLGRDGAIQVAGDVRQIARGRHVLRLLEDEAAKIKAGRFHPGALSGALDGIQQSLARDFAPDASGDDDLMQLNAAWDRHEKEGTSPLLATGIRLLDELIGGLPQSLSLIVGDQGKGKTGVVASMIDAQLRSGCLGADGRIGLFGLEDGTGWLAKRLVAKHMGVPLIMVGGGRPGEQRTVDQIAALGRANEELYPLLQRVTCFRRASITTNEMVRLASKWVYQGNVRCIYVDHLGEMDHRDPRRREEYWQQVSETVRRMRDFARQHGVPVVVLAHTTDDGPARGEGPPRASALAGGRSLDRKARFILGIWRKRDSLRGTILKSTETGSKDSTIEFERIFDAALIEPSGGRLVNLDAEAAEERSAKKKSLDAESDARSEERRLKREARKAAAARPETKKPPPADQPLLIEVSEGAKP